MKNMILNGTRLNKAAVLLASLSAMALTVAASTPALATGKPRLPSHFSGLLNDYTSPAVTNGPYEMHGIWSLTLNEEKGSAVFTAEMTMQTADFANASGDPTKLLPHTHHIRVTDGVMHTDPSDPVTWQGACTAVKPPVTDGFVVTGTAYVTGNGANAPFGNPSSVTICVLGGSESVATPGQAFVTFANFQLKFTDTGHASTHFGSQAINGVVTKCAHAWNPESEDCRLQVAN
jgi:hypothetical protein